MNSNLSLLELLSEILEEQYPNEELTIQVKKARTSLVIKDESIAFIEYLRTKIEVYDYQLFTFDNLELKGVEKWHKVFDTHVRFKKCTQQQPATNLS